MAVELFERFLEGGCEPPKYFRQMMEEWSWRWCRAGRRIWAEQGLVSGVMRCLFCGQFPLLCVVHALVAFSSFLSHPEDRSWLRPPPSLFLPPLVADCSLRCSYSRSRVYLDGLRTRTGCALYASRARHSDQAVQHYGSEPRSAR